MSNMQIAQTIISQLGGEKFSQRVQPFNMTPAHGGVSFQFLPKSSYRLNKMEVRLIGDTYEVTFQQVDSVGTVLDTVKVENVIAPMLTRVFCEHTGYMLW